MRVIAGSAGGIRLYVPKNGLRPTMDRVKEAIFSSLGERIIGTRVLDLFAGTGALAIEALSRGAASATLVESNREALAAIEQNLARTHLEARVRRQEVLEYLSRASSGESYDLIFADPPYDRAGESFTDLLLASKQLPPRLTSKGLFVLEKRPSEKLFVPVTWELLRRRTYGATETLFLRRVAPNE